MPPFRLSQLEVLLEHLRRQREQEEAEESESDSDFSDLATGGGRHWGGRRVRARRSLKLLLRSPQTHPPRLWSIISTPTPSISGCGRLRGAMHGGKTNSLLGQTP